jgi:2-dehydropantoate 2-reductase
MRVAILGAGAMGGYDGARLANAGEEVVFVARGAHLQALKSYGLRVKTADAETIVCVTAYGQKTRTRLDSRSYDPAITHPAACIRPPPSRILNAK